MNDLTGTFSIGKYIGADEEEKTFVIFKYKIKDESFYTRANFKEGTDDDSLEVALGKICAKVAEVLKK